MKKILAGLLWRAMFCAPALLVAGCSAGTVVDEQGKPLAGVHVVAAYWIEGPYFVHPRKECVRVETMATGADGKFNFPFFSGNFNPTVPTRTTMLAYFKAGYELVPERKESDDPIKMRPFSGEAKHRFDHFFGAYNAYTVHSRCPEGVKKLRPVLVAVHAELKQIAKTYEERERVIMFEYQLEEIPTIARPDIDPSDVRAGLEWSIQEDKKNQPARERAEEKRRQLKKEFGITK